MHGFFILVSLQFPVDGFTGHQGNDLFMTEWQFIGNLPFFLNQCDFVSVNWQIVEFRSVDTGKPLQFFQFTDFLKGLYVQFDSMRSGITSRTAASVFFCAFGMWCRIGSGEET